MSILPASEAEFFARSTILIIGAGACGLTAALAARELGADVLILERDAAPHGNTSLSQGTLYAAGTSSQILNGVQDSSDILFADLMAQSAGSGDPILSRYVADNAGRTVDWLVEAHRIPLAHLPEWAAFGHSCARLHRNPSLTGAELHGALLRAASDMGADLVTNARAVALFAEEDGTVRGVRIQRPDGLREDIGCDVMILATNGYGANKQMLRRFAPTMADTRYFGWEGNEGDGIIWGMELGGALGDMTSVQNFGALAEPSGIMLSYEIYSEGAIQIDRDGRRFSHEIEDISGQGDRVAALPDQLSWVLLDERRHRELLTRGEYREAIELGIAKRAETFDELVSITGARPDLLCDTFREVELLAGTGTPDRFNRVFPADGSFHAPYYAIRVGPALLHTLGGLLINSEGRVIREDGRPLPNLFAGGGVIRNMAGPNSSGYLPGSGLTLACVTGRLIGQSAGRAALLRTGKSATV